MFCLWGLYAEWAERGEKKYSERLETKSLGSDDKSELGSNEERWDFDEPGVACQIL